MDMFEEAAAMSGMIKLCDMTQDSLAKKMGVSQSYIANKLRLLNFSEEMRARIRTSGVSERHARALLRLEDDFERGEVLEKIVDCRLNVRETESLIDSMVDGNAPVLIERAPKLNKISTFTSTLKHSVETLCAMGIYTESRTSYYGNKMYITLCINDV